MYSGALSKIGRSPITVAQSRTKVETKEMSKQCEVSWSHYLQHWSSDRSCQNWRWPIPANLEDLRQFLGISSYYRKFISNFATIAAPLYKLTGKTNDWNWSLKCQNAFVTLKLRLSSPPLLAFPYFDQPFILDTNATREGLRAVLSQRIGESKSDCLYKSGTN